MSAAAQVIPPLSQSKHEASACEVSYVAIHIDGRSAGDSEASDRGSEVHDVMAKYISHCAQIHVASDWVRFNQLAKEAKAEAGGILDGLRDTYSVQWNLVYGTEITMMLDEHLVPTLDISDEHWPKHIPSRNFLTAPGWTGGYCAHIGTADVILISEDGERGKIVDFKTHPSPFDADTYQGLLYSFMLLKHMPELNQVTFELVFARYQNCTRSIAYKRKDMPEMQQTIMRAREKQKAIHAHPEKAEAIPCKQCAYCPLGILTLECPIKEQNPMVNLSLESRLIFKEWTRRMNDDNTRILKTHAEVTGPIRYTDGNGRVYEFGKLDVPSTRFPLDQAAIQLLVDHATATGENLLDGRLNISSTKIKGLLKTKKRAMLMEQFEESVIETSTKPKWSVRTPDEGFVPEYNPYESED
jgi:hypothetical protein